MVAVVIQRLELRALYLLVQAVQIEVGEQRRNDAVLWRAGGRVKQPEGYENSDSSCCQLIFMDETTEDLLAPETRNKLRWCDDCAGLGCAKLQPAMRSSSVVVQNELGEDGFEVSSGDDQKVVETFLADRSDPSLGVGVRVRRPNR